MNNNIPKNEDEWKEKLTPEQFAVLREGATEAPFSSEHITTDSDGTFLCAGCGAKLFAPGTKFDSGSGWPSFDAALPDAVVLKHDTSHGMERTEVVCSACQSHLGHVFDDGPTETGKRYCINGMSLEKEKE